MPLGACVIINTLDVDVFFYVFNTAVRTGREREGVYTGRAGAAQNPLSKMQKSSTYPSESVLVKEVWGTTARRAP